MHVLEPLAIRAPRPEFTRRRRDIGLGLQRLSFLVNIPMNRLRAIEMGDGRPPTVREVERIDRAISILEAAHLRLRLELGVQLLPGNGAPDGRGGGAA